LPNAGKVARFSFWRQGRWETINDDAKKDSQKRALSPSEALAAGANWLVIARPIYAAENPRAAAENILASLEQP